MPPVWHRQSGLFTQERWNTAEMDVLLNIAQSDTAVDVGYFCSPNILISYFYFPHMVTCQQKFWVVYSSVLYKQHTLSLLPYLENTLDHVCHKPAKSLVFSIFYTSTFSCFAQNIPDSTNCVNIVLMFGLLFLIHNVSINDLLTIHKPISCNWTL